MRRRQKSHFTQARQPLSSKKSYLRIIIIKSYGKMEILNTRRHLCKAIQNVGMLYVKGREKSLFIHQVTGKVTINLDELEYPQATLPLPKEYSLLFISYSVRYSLSNNCNNNIPCSLIQALKFKEWLTGLFERAIDE